MQNVVSSFIQTLLLVTDSDRISRLDAVRIAAGSWTHPVMQPYNFLFFSYTVTMLSGITTSREFHPAPKNLPLCILYIVILFAWKCKRKMTIS
jgi:hypothetical protein